MELDSVTKAIAIEISNETGVSLKEVEHTLDFYYKSVTSSIREGHEHIKLDHLCSFKLRNKFKNEE